MKIVIKESGKHITHPWHADKQRLLGVADGLVVLLGVVFNVGELLPILVVEVVVGVFVLGDHVDSVSLVVVPSHHNGARESLLGSGAEAGICSADLDAGHVARPQLELVLGERLGGLGVEIVPVDELQLQLLHSSPQHDVEEGLGRGRGTGSKIQLPYCR